MGFLDSRRLEVIRNRRAVEADDAPQRSTLFRGVLMLSLGSKVNFK